MTDEFEIVLAENLSKFICIDDPKLVKFQNAKDGGVIKFSIAVDRCTDGNCRPEEEISALEQTYVGELLMWSQEFKPHLYDEDMVFSFFTCVLNFAKGWG